MSLTENGGLSAADIAAVTGGNGFGGFGTDGGALFWLLVLFLFGFGNNGWGNGAYGGNIGSEMYPWMNQSQQINDGFRDQMLNGNIQGMGGQSEGYSNRRMSLYYDGMPPHRGSYNHAYNNYRDPYYDNYHGDSYERGRSPVTGRYISNDSYERGYSGHSIKDRMIARLEDMYDEAKTDHERQVVSETIQKIQSGR